MGVEIFLQMPERNLSHAQCESSFEKSKLSLVEKIERRGDLPHASVEKQLDILQQLSQFELGRFLIERAGLNGYWTHYIISHPFKGRLRGLNQHNRPFLPLENFLLNRAPVCLATQQRFTIFKPLIVCKSRFLIDSKYADAYLHDEAKLGSLASWVN